MNEFHPIADLFPLMQGAEFDDLVNDIRQHGLHEPVWLYEGKVLDGRNRLRACNVADVEPEFREYDGDDPVGFVVSLNLHRRHLNESQRAMLAGKVAKIPNGGDRKSDQWTNSSTDLTNSKAAKLLNVGTTAIKAAKQVQSKGVPDLIQKVDSGEVRVSAAADIAGLPKSQQEVIASLGAETILRVAKEIRSKKESERRKQRMNKLSELSTPELSTERKYPVILADPPWEYDYSTSNSRRVDNHYPVMSLKDIQSMPVLQIATDSAALFMWATSPKLTDSLVVMSAWGFTYRTCAVWDKQVIGMGYWFRQQTELLLVGTRGQMPAPDPSVRAPSLITAKRNGHSEKPEEVYRIIESMFPGLPKIELFSRRRREGWSAFGNEVA